MLREKTCHLRICRADGSAVARGFLAHQESKHGRLSLAVAAHDADLIARSHHKVDILKELELFIIFRAIAVCDAPQLRQDFGLCPSTAILGRFREPEVDALHKGRGRINSILVDIFELLGPLLTCLCQGLVALVHFDVFLQLLSPLLLEIIFFLPVLHFHFLLPHKVRVVAFVAVGHPFHCLHNSVAYAVHELSVVGHNNHRQVLLSEILLNPFDCLQVQVICRLVQQQDIRPEHEDLANANPHLPSAAEESHFAIQVVGFKTRYLANRVDGVLQSIHLIFLSLCCQFGEPVDKSIHLFDILRVFLQFRLNFHQLIHDGLLLWQG
mmetsp:Transcript_41348/g.89614  ORF Transcript_41348/g.89614 Transcript_41348/m.89614 type:complete len:325 (-) Transcript_41348:1341-2315(-)